MFLRTVRLIADGKSMFFQPKITDTVNDSRTGPISPSLKPDLLTSKEITILRLVAKGLSNKDIASRLGLSVANIKSTLTAIFVKSGVSSRTEAASVGLQDHILTLSDLNR